MSTTTALACGGPLPGVDAPTGAGATDGRDAAVATATGTFHTLTVTLCARDLEACTRARASGGDGAYRLAFGSSGGALRTHDQVVADLYRELRDRTELGTRLMATAMPLAAPDGGAAFAPGPTPGSTRPGADAPSATDVLVDAARQIADAVDAAGEVAIDVAHIRPGCKVSLAMAAEGTRRCLVHEEGHPGPHDNDAPRNGHEDRFK